MADPASIGNAASTSSDVLSRLRELDSQGQLDAVLATGDHLRDALWRIESARLTDFDGAGAMVCGMGGSGIGGLLAAAAIGDRATKPVLSVSRYELPSWVTPDWAILCSSYSGNTEETIACLEAAGALGARTVVATTGGALADAAREKGVPVIGLPAALQPRAAVGYMFAVAAEVAALAEAAPRIHTEIDATAARLDEGREQTHERAAELAARLEGTIPVIYGADLTAAAALRWKTQINENGKLPCFWSELPEADHNELPSWEGAEDRGLSAVFLEDSDQHPRERQRIELTAELVAETAADVIRIESEGESRSERLLGLVMLGDLVSLHLAARRGVDPSPVDAIERLKDRLGRPG